MKRILIVLLGLVVLAVGAAAGTFFWVEREVQRAVGYDVASVQNALTQPTCSEPRSGERLKTENGRWLNR